MEQYLKAASRYDDVWFALADRYAQSAGCVDNHQTSPFSAKMGMDLRPSLALLLA